LHNNSIQTLFIIAYSLIVVTGVFFVRRTGSPIATTYSVVIGGSGSGVTIFPEPRNRLPALSATGVIVIEGSVIVEFAGDVTVVE
jgi:hypothetical protein